MKKERSGPALVDAGVVESRREDTCQRCIDKFDNNTIAIDCSNEFRSIEASHCQVLLRTTARTVQQTKGQKGFEAWRAIVCQTKFQLM